MTTLAGSSHRPGRPTTIEKLHAIVDASTQTAPEHRDHVHAVVDHVVSEMYEQGLVIIDARAHVIGRWVLTTLSLTTGALALILMEHLAII